MKKITVEVSARHVHLSAKHLAILFGKNYQLTKLHDLSQTGQYACKEAITLKTKGGQLEKLRLIGPVRSKTQVEISLTDARKLKITPPVRLSGDLSGSVGATLIGPKGMVKLREGVIIAQRHVHCDPATAKALGLTAKSIMEIKLPGVRALTFYNIPVRIDPSFVFRLHLDTDEANAALIESGARWEIIKTKKK
jgi:putative phosphotransacetylase